MIFKNGSPVRSYSYAYDKNSMRTGMTDNNGTHSYLYDPLYQIIEATHPTPPRPLEQFQYDAVGNRLGGGRAHNELNQLTEDDLYRYVYDADGNMTAKVGKATGDSTVYTWDIENKLVEVREPDMLARYTYDAFGRRMSKEVNGVKTQFRYDGFSLILEMNQNDTVEANYSSGPGVDNPLMMSRNGNSYYFVKDGLGSVSALTNNSGNIVHEYKYSVFGEIVSETGDSIDNPFTFTSRELDRETGNYYYRARYYEPRIGRFISEDQLGVASGYGANLFRYVWNSPLSFVDPFGYYGSDVHLVLTYDRAMANGISPNTAVDIAIADNAFDEFGSSTFPGYNPWPHFQQYEGHEMRDFIYNQAVEAAKAGNSEVFGQLLHQFQDTYSHEGFKPIPGHLMDMYVDRYDPDSVRDKTMKFWLDTLLKQWKISNPCP